jgi:YHS domain-containing protein
MRNVLFHLRNGDAVWRRLVNRVVIAVGHNRGDGRTGDIMMIRANQASRRHPSSRIAALATIVRLVLAAFGCIGFVASPSFALDERIVFDPYTGLSLGGYDPVAYFVDGEAKLGVPDFEVVVGDTYWHFVNASNADAFRSNPDIYVPGFGGYSVGAVARGLPQPGNPAIFVVHRERVYLFASEDERQAFLADPDAAIAAATARWPDVLKLLAY